MAQSVVTTIHKFDGNNYHQWKFQVRCALKAKGVWDIASGTSLKPATTATNSDDIDKWEKNDAIAMCIITAAMDLKQISLVEICESSKSIFDKLDSIYCTKSETSKMLVHDHFYQYQMDPSDSIIQHIAKVENLAQQIKDAGEMISEAAIMTKILGTLPSKYRHFRQAWISTEETKQTLSNLTIRLIDEEKNLTANEKEESALFMSKNPKKSESKPQDKQQSRKITCYYCRKKGHIAKDCWNKKKGSKSAENSTNNTNGSYSAAFVLEKRNICIEENEKWILDSGASAHMTSHREFFKSLRPVEAIEIILGSGEQLRVTAIGEIEVDCWVEDKWNRSLLSDVWFVEGLKKNLLSEGVITKKGFSVTKQSDTANICDGNGVLKANAVRENNNLYKMLMRSVIPKCSAKPEVNVTANEELKLWHERLGHPGIQTIRKMINSGLLNDINTKNSENFVCEGCQYGKQHKLPFNVATPRDSSPGEFIHSDVCGPMSVPSVGGYRYYLLFKDDCSGYCVVYFMHHKSDTFDCLKQFLALCKNKFNRNVKTFRFDNGTEYINENVLEHLNKHGIQLETSAPYTHEQNGTAERENRTIMEKVRSMLHGKNLPLYLWAEAVNTAVYLSNRTPNVHTPQSTPFEQWYGRKPKLNHIRIFGCQAFMHLPKNLRRKLDKKSEKLTFVGYENDSSNYRLFDCSRKKVKISRDVVFNESLIGVDNYSTNNEKVDLLLSNNSEENLQDNQVVTNNVNNERVNENKVEKEKSDGETNEQPRFNLRKRENLQKPLRYELNLVEIDDVPTTFEEAMNSDMSHNWKTAIKEELTALDKNETWELVPAPHNARIIGSKWVFKVKRAPDGTINRYKARLCAKGFSQVEGIDYNETFAPTTRFDTIRVLLAIAVSNKFNIVQFDIKTAFLHGELEENIFMEPPPGVKSNGLVCKLKKALYGLKQAPRCWNKTFRSFLKTFEFISCESDPCVFTTNVEGYQVILVLYVDDGLIMCKSEDILTKITTKMQSVFEISLSAPNYFVGLEINVNKEENYIFIHIKSFIDRLIKRFNLSDVKKCSIPADPHSTLQSADRVNNLQNNTQYRSAVGCLIFAAITARPDISFAVNVVSRFQNNPSDTHWNAVKRILSYLKSTADYGLRYSIFDSENLIGYSDADFANDPDTRKSTTGYVFKINNTAVTWNSRRQSTVSLSTTEAEFIAAAETTKEALWLKCLLREIGQLKISDAPVVLGVDNQSAITLFKNTTFHKRTKHIDVKYKFVREKFESKEINIMYVPTEEQIADIFTKAIPFPRFVKLRESLGIISINM